MALSKTSAIYQWGENIKSSIVSEKNKAKELVCYDNPVIIPWKKKINKISVGQFSTSFLTERGKVYYWGEFEKVYDKINRLNFKKIVLDITLGTGFMLFVSEDKEVFSYGRDIFSTATNNQKGFFS